MNRIGRTSRSLDGFTSTLIMVDEYSHIVWLKNMQTGQELEELLIRVAKGEHMPDYQNHYSYLF